MLKQRVLHLVLIIAPGQGAFLFAFLNLLGHAFDHLHQFRWPDGLEQVLIHPQRDGLLGGLKIAKAADDDDFQPRHHGLGMADQLEAVQKGHADIRQHDVGHQVLHHRKRHFPIGGLAAEGKGPGHILDHIADALADQQFILHHKNLIHGAPPLRLDGWVMHK